MFNYVVIDMYNKMVPNLDYMYLTKMQSGDISVYVKHEYTI